MTRLRTLESITRARATRTGLALFLLLALLSADPRALDARQASPEEGSPPPLTILVVVDQLRADLLDRYDEAFTQGLRRLRDGGYHFTRTTHDHALTLTAPGHATIVTGTHPSTHGVISNAWIADTPQGRRMVENVVDAANPVVGVPQLPGASPAPLKRSTLAEWLQSEHPEARVLSVSGKSRAAVLMAGHAEADVFWFDEAAERFVTSVYYTEDEPEWVERFNADDLAPMAADTVWALEVPAALRSLARPDSAVWEGDGVHTTFPHRWSDGAQGRGITAWEWWSGTPGLDRATRILAQRGIEALEIGTDAVPDLVAVSFSGTDRVGHAYGPTSLEQLDNLIRLDAELGTFLAWLDVRFGEDGYLVALTADHGVADAPEVSAQNGLPAFRITTDSAFVLQTLLNDIAREAGTDPAVLAPALAEGIPEAISWVDRGWTFAELLEAGDVSSDSLTLLQSRSTHPGLLTGVLGGQGIELLYSPWTLSWSFPRGTTHGTPYLYDRHVPFVLYGRGISGGSADDPVGTVDIAPTLAGILGISVPDGVEGRARELSGGDSP